METCWKNPKFNPQPLPEAHFFNNISMATSIIRTVLLLVCVFRWRCTFSAQVPRVVLADSLTRGYYHSAPLGLWYSGLLINARVAARIWFYEPPGVGSRSGSQFWGCQTYPACKATLPIR